MQGSEKLPVRSLGCNSSRGLIREAVIKAPPLFQAWIYQAPLAPGTAAPVSCISVEYKKQKKQDTPFNREVLMPPTPSVELEILRRYLSIPTWFSLPFNEAPAAVGASLAHRGGVSVTPALLCLGANTNNPAVPGNFLNPFLQATEGA